MAPRFACSSRYDRERPPGGFLRPGHVSWSFDKPVRPSRMFRRETPFMPLEKAIAAKIGATPTIKEVRIFETHPEFRREVWVVEHQGQQFAFDIYLRPSLRGGVDSTLEGPVEIHGSLE